MRAQLIPLEGGQPVEITRDLTLVGRKEDCDLRLDHKSVSKMHCVIVKTDGLLLLRDLGSTNGTRINGQRVRRAALLPNDQLAVATFKFRVQLGLEAASVSDHTQHLAADELRRPSGQAPRTDKAHIPQPNALPDVYPDEPHRLD